MLKQLCGFKLSRDSKLIYETGFGYNSEKTSNTKIMNLSIKKLELDDLKKVLKSKSGSSSGGE